MTNYSELSDFEINKLVAEFAIGGEWFIEPTDDNPCFFYNNGIATTKAILLPDYCNNADHAWTIIINNKISLLWNCGSWSSWAGEFPDIEESHENPLRAAMVVYLMMQEQQHD